MAILYQIVKKSLGKSLEKSEQSCQIFLDFCQTAMHSSTIMNVPIYLSAGFEWKGNKGVAEHSKLKNHTVGTRQSPDNENGVFIFSVKTGVVKYFAPVYDEDGYDGEFMIYSYNDEYFVRIWNY